MHCIDDNQRAHVRNQIGALVSKMHKIAFQFDLARRIELEKVLYLILYVYRIKTYHLEEFLEHKLSICWHSDVCEANVQDNLQFLD